MLIHWSEDGVTLQSKPDWQKFREVKEKIAVKFLKPDVGFKVINLGFLNSLVKVLNNQVEVLNNQVEVLNNQISGFQNCI